MPTPIWNPCRQSLEHCWNAWRLQRTANFWVSDDFAAIMDYLVRVNVGGFFFRKSFDSRSVNAFCYYGNVQFATVLVQSHDECHGGNANDTQTTQCKPLTRDDYELLVYTTIAEFPGLILTLFIIEYLGRKKTMALEFGIFMSFTLLLFLCLGRTMVTVFIFIARAFISGAFQCAYVYTPEVSFAFRQ